MGSDCIKFLFIKKVSHFKKISLEARFYFHFQGAVEKQNQDYYSIKNRLKFPDNLELSDFSRVIWVGDMN